MLLKKLLYVLDYSKAGNSEHRAGTSIGVFVRVFYLVRSFQRVHPDSDQQEEVEK